jgi:hypothetical protein
MHLMRPNMGGSASLASQRIRFRDQGPVCTTRHRKTTGDRSWNASDVYERSRVSIALTPNDAKRSACVLFDPSGLLPHGTQPRTYQETHGRGIISGIFDGVAQAAVHAPLRKVTSVGTPPLLREMHVSHQPLGALGITIRRD